MTTPTPQQALLVRVEAFLVETGMAISRFGILAVNDRSFVPDLRDGKREFRFSTIERVDKFMAEFREEKAA